MIKITKIKIEEFRGIRDLTIETNGKNFVVCGPNGTGKSGIVDALEFGLTGNISRLSGAGRGNLSVKEHAPHVDSRDNPSKAIVTLSVEIPSIKKSAVIERSVKDPRNPKITPNDPEIIKVFEEVAIHPEFVLSRREIINYIISEPGKRSQEIQALLKLEQVEKVRALLQRISNGHKRDLESFKMAYSQATQNLGRSLGISHVEDKGILDSVNKRRAILNLAPIEALIETTSLKDGLSTASSNNQTLRIPKVQVISDIAELNKIVDELYSEKIKNDLDEIIKELLDFSSEPMATENATKEDFLKDALSFIDQELCPVCDTPWNIDELKKIINAKIEKFNVVSKRRAEIEKRILPIIYLLQSLQSSLSDILNYKLLLPTSLETQAVNKFKLAIIAQKSRLESFLPILETIEVLKELKIRPSSLGDFIAKVEAVVKAIPEPTSQDEARDFIVLAQEKLEAYRSAKFNLKKVEDLANISAKVAEAYVEVSNSVLDEVYKEVQKEFSELYEFMNQGDEVGFSAKLLPSAGKLGFDVDFYGKGFFPPGAYHSEGHQDVMGLCLYLSLMRHILGSNFTLAVLDDVVMSVDSGHRRQVCALLSKLFKDTQFIITTHDKVWLNHMKSEGLISENSCTLFSEWNVDDGPTEWDQRNVWDEIQASLKKDDVSSAAGLLRRYLEYLFGEVCHRLRAYVEYRGDAQFQYGDLVFNGAKALKSLLKYGKDSATSWTQTDKVNAITEKENVLGGLLKKINYDQWEMNASIHFNEWDNLSREDFAPVAETFKEFVDQFKCLKCGSLLEVVPNRGTRQSLKCACGDININLEKKKADPV